MSDSASVSRRHPLRKLFRSALDFGLKHNPTERIEVANYIEDQILCAFIHADNLFKIKNDAESALEDIADLTAEGNLLMKADSFQREFHVHKHIGDYTLFMLGMFPAALSRRKGREFILGKLIIPEASLSEYYMLRGRRSYGIASEFTDGDIFLELSENFHLYQNIMELVRIFLDANGNKRWLKKESIIN